MRLGFTGTRRGMTAAQRDRCAALLLRWQPAELHHGDALGADAELHQIARENGIRIVVHPANVPQHRAFSNGDRVEPPRTKRARDRAIVDASDLVLATPAPPDVEGLESGTWYTIQYALFAGEPVIIVWPDGT